MLIYQYCLRGRFEHNLKEGGGATKRASSFIYNIPSTYTGENFGLLTYLTKVQNYGKDRLNQSKAGIR